MEHLKHWAKAFALCFAEEFESLSEMSTCLQDKV